MSRPTLSILIAGLHSRPWQDIAAKVQTQAMSFGTVEVLNCIDGGERTSGQKRQELLTAAKGTYVACLDDDDDIADTYIADILKGCQSGADVVTFMLSMWRNGRFFESWQFGLRTNLRKHGMMCVNHLCAWRREIAQRVAWCPDLGYADDQLWFGPLFAAGLVSTQYHIQKPLYRYLYSHDGTANQTGQRIQRSRAYFGSGLRCFRDAAGEIFVEVGGRTSAHSPVMVRDRNSNLLPFDSATMTEYHVVRMQ